MTLRRSLSTLAALLAATALVLGAGPRANAVIGGTAAAEGSLPFMASIQDPDGFAFCGGSVVSSTWVLTAAHCVSPNDNIYVVTGRTNLGDTGTGQRIHVASIHIHPNFDAALLRLASATSSAPIRLATASDDVLETPGTTVTVAGWGDTLPTLGLFSTNELQKTKLKVVSDSECGQTNFGFHGPSEVCAAELLKDSCQGDSGGPLWGTRAGAKVQIGIVSYGTGCAFPKFPGVYAEVNNSSIRSWITTTSGV